MNARAEFLDKITPQDLMEAEQTVLACVFAANEVLNDCGLEPDDFVSALHRKIYATAAEHYAGHQIVNSVTLKPFIPKQIEGLDISPAEYLSKLMILGARPEVRSRLDASIQIIKGMTMARQLEQEAQIATNIAKEGHSLLTLGDEIEKLEQRLKEIRSRFSETTALVSPGNSYLAMFNASAKRDGVVGVPIALPEIASVLSEPVFESGNLYGLLSSSGEGKSSLTMQLIFHAVKSGHPVLFLSYDQSAAQCVRQMIAQVHSIDVRQQRDPMGMMEQGERDRCVRFATWINEQPLDIIRCQREGVEKLVAYARRFIKKRANGLTPFIVIDHIGKVKPKDPKLSPDRISGDITVELKALMDETHATCLVLNQRNGNGTKRDNPRPIAADLYGGEGARADYDAILYLYSQEKYKAERESIAAKPSDWTTINRVFGSEVAGIREVGSIKCRFGDPTLKAIINFEARYTRYTSPVQPQQQARMF